MLEILFISIKKNGFNTAEQFYFQEAYNTGDYIDAVVNRQRAETISSILYPDDRSHQVGLISFNVCHIFFFIIWLYYSIIERTNTSMLLVCILFS